MLDAAPPARFRSKLAPDECIALREVEDGACLYCRWPRTRLAHIQGRSGLRIMHIACSCCERIWYRIDVRQVPEHQITMLALTNPLRLTPRTLAILKGNAMPLDAAGLSTVTADELTNLRGIGPARLAEIRNALAGAGLKLADDPIPLADILARWATCLIKTHVHGRPVLAIATDRADSLHIDQLAQMISALTGVEYVTESKYSARTRTDPACDTRRIRASRGEKPHAQ